MDLDTTSVLAFGDVEGISSGSWIWVRKLTEFPLALHTAMPVHRDSLIKDANKGGVTLVLGAGVSAARGIPEWDGLAEKLWNEIFWYRESPWEVEAEAKSPREVPQFLPIVFELVYRKLGEKRFLRTLRKHLYGNVRRPADEAGFPDSKETLAVIARIIVREFRSEGRRRLDGIITLNADDLLEEAVDCMSGGERHVVRVAARSTHSHFGGRGVQPIPIYHLHGFLPGGIRKDWSHYWEHSLVFTDAQYWSSSARSVSFANRVMASALTESRCIFIGLSMTDINLLRWLALRANEFDQDTAEGDKRRPSTARENRDLARRQSLRKFRRHYWVRPASTDPTGFLSDFLKVRGIDSVEIQRWGGPRFAQLMERCFSDDAGEASESRSKKTTGRSTRVALRVRKHPAPG